MAGGLAQLEWSPELIATPCGSGPGPARPSRACPPRAAELRLLRHAAALEQLGVSIDTLSPLDRLALVGDRWPRRPHLPAGDRAAPEAESRDLDALAESIAMLATSASWPTP